jgi:hypothetical protein
MNDPPSQKDSTSPTEQAAVSSGVDTCSASPTDKQRCLGSKAESGAIQDTKNETLLTSSITSLKIGEVDHSAMSPESAVQKAVTLTACSVAQSNADAEELGDSHGTPDKISPRAFFRVAVTNSSHQGDRLLEGDCRAYFLTENQRGHSNSFTSTTSMETASDSSRNSAVTISSKNDTYIDPGWGLSADFNGTLVEEDSTKTLGNDETSHSPAPADPFSNSNSRNINAEAWALSGDWNVEGSSSVAGTSWSSTEAFSRNSWNNSGEKNNNNSSEVWGLNSSWNADSDAQVYEGSNSSSSRGQGCFHCKLAQGPRLHKVCVCKVVLELSFPSRIRSLIKHSI